MAHEPKKRHSTARQGKRRHAIRLDVNDVSICSHCKSVVKPHTICASCGYYKGKQVMTRV